MEEKAAVAVLLCGTPVSGTIPDTYQPVPAPSERSVHPLGHDAPGRAGPFLRSGTGSYRCHAGHCCHRAANITNCPVPVAPPNMVGSRTISEP